MAKKKEGKIAETISVWIGPVKHIGLSAMYGILFFFLIANIILSQRFPTVYFGVANGQENALVEFFKKAKPLSSFYSLFPEIKSEFSAHEGEIYQEDRTRKELIDKLEVLLEKNPKSRDMLYSLYLLYDKEGNSDKALEYLKRAQEIDPSIKN